LIKTFLLACVIFATPVMASEISAPPVEVKKPISVRDLINQYDWDTDVAYAVMMAESSASSTVVNWKDSHRGCSGSYGLFQIGCLHETDPEILKDPEYNVQRAYELYKQNGWRIWGGYTNKSYLRFLK
jgi:hypothetical protein